MKKTLTALLFFCAFCTAKAQDLAKKIPSNAFTIATIKGDNVFKLMFVKDFDESILGRKLLSGSSESLNKNLNSIEDFGIDLQKNMYYFNQLNDSITYHQFLIPLKDAQKFESIMASNNHQIQHQGGLNTFVLPDSSGLLMWNKGTLYGAIGSIKPYFFADSAKAAKYGIKETRFIENYGESAVDSVSVDSAWVAVPEVAVEPVEVPKAAKIKTVAPKNQKKKTTAKSKSKKAKKLPEPVEEMENLPVEAVAPPTDFNKRYDEYEKERAEQDAKKKALALIWLKVQAEKILNGSFESIENNPSYKSSLDQESIASLWISSLESAYGTFASDLGKYGRANVMSGYGSLNAKLFMDKTSFRISTGLELSKNQAEAYKKITKKKINKKLTKYVDSEKAIGFMSYAIDSKAYLEEFPKFLKQSYGSFLGANMDEELDLATDFFSLLLDEEAVSKVVKGDALFVINGLNTKDVTYTTYDYDDDYNQKEVIKTRKETLPDFLFIFSSEDTRLINKVIKYGINKNKVSLNGDVYRIIEKKSPVDIYFTIKDGLVFFGNSETDMQAISKNEYHPKISSVHKKLMSNNFSFLFNTKNLVGKVPEEEIGGKETAAKFNETLAKMGNVYMKSNPMKGNVVSADISAEIPNGQENALKYLFSLIENAIK
ncbi:hypothetical protein ACJVDH_12970 [Pedobacter sp. AW1-32]|uniref:hypothetical protein n=1 Tax=Pedobacter sp. AW1-32 TaxID=3383026 RepID=UPI003FEEF508